MCETSIKRCSACGETKPLDQFYKRRDNPGGAGYRSQCKACFMATCNATQDPELAKIRRARFEQSEGRREWARQWHRENGWKYRTHKPPRPVMSPEEQAQANRRRVAEYRQRHPDRARDTIRRWRESGGSAAAADRRRALKLGAAGDATAQDRRQRWDYYGGQCWICGGAAATTDHVVALTRGGCNWPANLRPACKSCNSRKGTKDWRPFQNERRQRLGYP